MNRPPWSAQRSSQPVKRDEIDTIAERIRELGIKDKSKNFISKALFNLVYGGRHAKKIDEALERLGSSQSSSLPSSVGSSAFVHTSEREIEEEGRSDPKIIKMQRKVG